MARSPSYRRAPSAASCSAMVSHPIRSNSSMAVPNATAPTTLGEPASSRSGGSVQITSSRSTRSTAPATGQEGIADLEDLAWPDQRARAEGRVQLVAAEGDEVGSRRAAVGAAPAAPHRAATGTPRACASAQISSTGGSHPSRWRLPSGPAAPAARRVRVEHPDHVRRVEGAAVPHSTQRRVATRAHGRRLAWCSTTVVTTTSSGPSRRR